MRTTLTLDDQLVTELKRLAAERAKPFKLVVNEVIRAGLRGGASRSERYRLTPVSLGAPLMPLTKALQLSDELEDVALLTKLEHRK